MNLCRIPNGASEVIISYKYRVYPERVAERKLDKALDTCRWLYNRLLEEISKSKVMASDLRYTILRI